MTLLFTILVTFFAGMGAGLGTGFAGMSAAAVISPITKLSTLNLPPPITSSTLLITARAITMIPHVMHFLEFHFSAVFRLIF